MAIDVSGRLLAGIRGDNCKLMRLNAGEIETIFEPNDSKYISAITPGLAKAITSASVTTNNSNFT